MLSAQRSRGRCRGDWPRFLCPDHLARQRDQMRRYRQAAKMAATELPDFEELWYVEDHADVADWLRAHG